MGLVKSPALEWIGEKSCIGLDWCLALCCIGLDWCKAGAISGGNDAAGRAGHLGLLKNPLH